MPLGAAYFLPQGQRGGCGIKKRGGVTSTHSLKSFVFCGLALLSGFPRADTEKSGETIAPPPETGFPAVPCSGAMWHTPYTGPKGSLSSVFIPAGRLGAAPQKGVLTERVRYPFPLVLHDSRSVLPSRVRFAASRPGRLRGSSNKLFSFILFPSTIPSPHEMRVARHRAARSTR